MTPFRDWPIPRKLAVLLIAVGALAVLCTGIATALTMASIIRDQTVREVRSVAEVVGINAAAAILFNDRDAATETLGAAGALKALRRARIVLPDGSVFATVEPPRANTAADADLATDWSHRLGSAVASVQNTTIPIVFQGDTLGQVDIQWSTARQAARLLRAWAGLGFIAVLAIAGAALLAWRLQRLISDPIRTLTRTMSRITAQADYSVRVAHRGQDEIGDLVDGFNSMIAGIDSRDQELNRYREHLEDQVAARTAALSEAKGQLEATVAELRLAKDAAEEASRAKSDFLATMSHEVRTPLNGVIAMSEILAESTDDPAQRRMVETIHQSGNALLSVIGDILDFSKMEAGRFELDSTAFPLGELVDSSLLIVGPKAREKGLDLHATIAPAAAGQYIGDRNRLRQVLLNLLSNAVKFTLSGWVSLEVTPGPDGAGLRFTVSDSGIGIAPDQRPLLFQQFSQLDRSTARRFGGTGLGLVISRRLVEMMDGTINLDSAPGKGSRFWFTVPLARAGVDAVGAAEDHPTGSGPGLPPAAKPALGAPKTLRPSTDTVVPLQGLPVCQTGPHVLVVDDETVNLQVIAAALGDRCIVETANDGPTALDRMGRDPLPELVLLDAMMPDMDGFDVCRRLKVDPRTRDVPVIFITAMTQVSDEARGLATGAVDYVTKPISPSVLKARVSTHLALREARLSLADRNRDLERRVDQRTRQLIAMQDVTIRALASLAETRDNETGNHIRRTQHYMGELAEALRTHPRYAQLLDPETIDVLFKSAPLHDIGKVGIPDAILLKPDRLTDDEMDIMKTHAALGRDALRAAADGGGIEQTGFLRIACDIAGSHHERWDGQGYPDGLAGDAIPFSARLMALADVYDALISARCYKPAFPHDKAIAIIREGRGTQFDPAVVDAFLQRADRFAAIAERFSDPDPATEPASAPAPTLTSPPVPGTGTATATAARSESPVVRVRHS